MVPWSKPIVFPVGALCIVIVSRLLLDSVFSDALVFQLAGGGMATVFVMCGCICSFEQEQDDKSIAHLFPQSLQRRIGRMLSVVHTLNFKK